MKKAIMRLIAGRCDIHDRPSALLIREMEAELGMDPSYREAKDFVESWFDPRIVDCGRKRCRDRR